MEQNSLISKMKPYELATLAARMCPEICVKSPARAIAAVERLLQKAREAIDRAHVEDEAQTPRADWIFALKAITGQKRRDRAVTRFLKFVERQSPKVKQQLDLYMRDGFPVDYMILYQEWFKKWLKDPKRKKGRQGRRTSDSDARLRTELVGLVPTKPPKPI